MARTKRTAMKPARISTRNRARSQSLETVKDAEFWYDDGTIILIAKDVEFRVYRGPLAKHSQVFRDMLSIPQPQPLPGLLMLPHSPADLRHFLRVLVLGGTIQEPPEAPTFHAVSAWIRLGHKYEVDKLVENGLQYLRRFYPGSLRPDPAPHHIWAGPIKTDRPADVVGRAAIAIVNLARLTGSHDLLPLALVECCKLGADIVNGHTREDGTVESLCTEDLGRCFAAKGALSELTVVGMYLRAFEFAQTDAGCLEGGECKNTLENSSYSFRASGCGSVQVAADDLLVEGRMESKITDSLCALCHCKIVSNVVRGQRLVFWNSLRKTFKLGGDGRGP